jgi:hypothetical protein
VVLGVVKVLWVFRVFEVGWACWDVVRVIFMRLI